MQHVLVSSFLILAYLYLVIQFDDDLMLLCEKIGFLKKSSRRWKFYNFVFYLALGLFAFVIASTRRDFYVQHPEWQ